MNLLVYGEAKVYDDSAKEHKRLAYQRLHGTITEYEYEGEDIDALVEIRPRHRIQRDIGHVRNLADLDRAPIPGPARKACGANDVLTASTAT